MFKAIIVDDEPIIAEALEDMLKEQESCEVLGTYTDPFMALAQAQSKTIKPDCAFLDIQMMGMNGFELAEQLLAMNRDIEIIFVTAYNHYAIQAFEINALDYLLKPVEPERLQKTVERFNLKKNQAHLTPRPLCRVKCFGGFEVFVGNQLIKWNRAKTRELFAYLLEWQGKSLSKYTLCEQFWPEQSQEQALANLQTAIWSIRKKFKELGYEGVRIEYSDHRYFISFEGLIRDTETFQKHYLAFKKSNHVEERKKAISCYKGEYMEGEDWLWSYADKSKYEKMNMDLLRKME